MEVLLKIKKRVAKDMNMESFLRIIIKAAVKFVASSYG